MNSEANFAKSYRQARRDFITACGRAGADAIARVHPAKGPDGKPLFCDSAALGARDAARGLLVIAGPDSAVTQFLAGGLVLPQGARLVVVNALDPFARAWGRPGLPPGWPQKTLADIATEDLSRTKALAVLNLDVLIVEAALAGALPGAAISMLATPSAQAQQAILAAMDAL